MLSQAAMGFGMLGSYNVFTAFSVIEWILHVSVYLLSFYFLYLIETRVEEPKIKTKISGIALVCNFLFICMCFVLTPQSDKELFHNPYYNKVKAFEKFGLLTYQLTDTTDFLSKNAPLTEEELKELDEYYQNYVPAEFNEDTYGLLKNANVIMLMLEGVETFMINEKYTPNLYNLMHSSNYFPNMYSVYSNIGTYDAEFKSLTSSMYYRGDNYYNYYADNSYPNSLPNVLRNNGYTVNSFHDYVGEFYNRDNMHVSLGFETYYSVEKMNYNFENDEVPQWPSDTVMFENMKDVYAPIQDKPFFSFILTVTTHGGYNYYRESLSEYYNILKQDEDYANKDLSYLTYMASCMDLDKGIGILLDDLEKKDLVDNTILMVYSDHKNYSDIQMTYEYKDLDENDPYSLEKVPLFISNPLLGTKTIDKKVSHYDLTPTILELLGIDYNSIYYYGQSVYLQKPIKPIILGYNNFFDDNIIVYNDEIISVNPLIMDPELYYHQKRELVYHTIEINQNTFISDYFSTKIRSQSD
jgi:phosphoglycerol transferase MdoB-like AlkP superfamily enzyme